MLNPVGMAAAFLYYGLTVYIWIIIIRCLLSFVNPDPRNPVVAVLYRITDPVLLFVRRKIPFTTVGAVDLSPVVVIMVLWVLREFLVRALIS